MIKLHIFDDDKQLYVMKYDEKKKLWSVVIDGKKFEYSTPMPTINGIIRTKYEGS